MTPMTIPNHITLDDFVLMPIGKIVALPADVLAHLQQDFDDQLRMAKAASDWLNGALTLKYAVRAQQERSSAGKDFGTTRFADGDVTIVADLPKKIDWDQARLEALTTRIREAGENPAEYLDVSFKVPERKYTAWPEHIRVAFEQARTVRAGKPTFRLSSN
jgi:hypothetical protein